MSRKNVGHVYLDYAASTPVDARVFKAMQPYFDKESGNPGSLHSFGQAAVAAVDKAREVIGNALGRPSADGFREVIFTGSATEANNLALKGIVKRVNEISRPARIVVSSVEHESVLETARELEKEGVDVVYLPVDKNGVVSLSALKDALTPDTVLVSVMYVNNETGAVQPIAKIAEIIREFRGAKAYPLLHTDASQALQFFSCRPAELGVDLMTLSGHKIYGPKGIGALYIEKKAKELITPLIRGGGQEFGMRSGTENVPAIAGLGKAVEIAEQERKKNTAHALKMRDRLLAGLIKIAPKIKMNGGNIAPHILNLWLPGHSAEDMLMRLDLSGIAVSSGSACRSRTAQSSYVLKAMGLPEKRIKESIRVSFGAPTTPMEIDAALKVFSSLLKN